MHVQAGGGLVKDHDLWVVDEREGEQEALALAATMGFPVALDIEQVVATNTRLAHRPSILQDLEAGRRMEIDALYSVPLQMARSAGVAMPTLEVLAGLIRVKARGRGLY